jgi:deoxyribodipyrimidine photo-lyase
MRRRAIVWFRSDLRLHDNEAITNALRMADEVIPIYVFDERIFLGKSRFGFSKTSRFRAKFIIESVADLRTNLRKIGSDLIVRTGKPEQILSELARETQSSWVVCNRERTRDEVEVQDALELALWESGVELIYTRGKMLYHTQDLPVPVQHTPDIFSQFRKDNENITPVRPPLPTPVSMPQVTNQVPHGDMPTLTDFGHEDTDAHPNAALVFKGGETEGLKRLQHYLWDTNAIATYKETRNGLLGADYSSKISPWLAQGCLSPKQVYAELKRYERECISNESTYWLFFELLWRDFFRLMGKKYCNRIFLKGGTQDKPLKHLRNNHEMFQLWANGQTGVPFIDANMRELASTGWMSNRGRQNVASFLVRDLKVNWQMGAEYFESLLLDYDPCSNWGNWNYVAGVGSDPREDRYFNILTQAKNYDPCGDFVRTWCTELRLVPKELTHRPDLISTAQKQVYKMSNYPKSVVRIEKWASI